MRSVCLIVSIPLLVLLLSLSAFAQTPGTSTVSIQDVLLHSEVLKNSATLQNSQYVSYGQNYYRPGAADNNASFALRVDNQFHTKNFGFQISGRNEYSATENWNYGDIYDLHAEMNLGRTKVSVGRKLERWSEWENNWQQGLFQPRYLENRLEPKLAGLTGVFISRNSEPVSFTLALLPISIPDFSAHFSVENDKFVSRNPWFNPPASQFSFQNVPGELRYSVNTPDTGKIIGHPGAAAKIEFQQKEYFLRLSAAYKPAAQLLLGFPSLNQFVVTANDAYMRINITPRVMYQRVVNLDQLVQLGSWTAGLSGSYENPQDDVPVGFTAAGVQPAWIMAASASRPLEEEGKNAARIQVGFLKITGGDTSDRGEFAQGTGHTLFERRYQYNEAYSLGVSKPWRGLARSPLETGLKVVYDRLQNGGVVSFNCGMNFGNRFRTDLEIAYLGLLAGKAEITDGFLAEYRANDRVGLGVSYVF